jgi:hypothetical protein
VPSPCAGKDTEATSAPPNPAPNWKEAEDILEGLGEPGAHARDLIQQLLNRDPAERRLFVKGIKSHPFFEGVDWLAIQTKQAPADMAPPPPYTLATNTKEDMEDMTQSVAFDINLITGAQPAHAQPAFDAIHEKKMPTLGDIDGPKR